MLRFRLGESYIWLFVVFLVVFLGSAAFCLAVFGSFKFAALTMPVFAAYLLACQIRSGVALDSWWQAKYQRGDTMYSVLLAWYAFAVVLISVFCMFFVRLAP